MTTAPICPLCQQLMADVADARAPQFFCPRCDVPTEPRTGLLRDVLVEAFRNEVLRQRDEGGNDAPDYVWTDSHAPNFLGVDGPIDLGKLADIALEACAVCADNMSDTLPNDSSPIGAAAVGVLLRAGKGEQ